MQEQDKTVIITGVAGNLGTAVAAKFLQEGYAVWGTTNPGGRHVENTDHDKLISRAVDLQDATATETFAAEVIATSGSFEVLVCTVGGFAMGTVAETTSAGLLQQYKLNVETTYHIARPVFLHMMQQGFGRIFFIGSKAGLDATFNKGVVAYGLAKAQLFRLADIFNDEARGTNVVTCVVVPGTIDTPQNRAAMPGADTSTWVSPEHIAGIIHFYCSIDADAIREPIIKLYRDA